MKWEILNGFTPDANLNGGDVSPANWNLSSGSRHQSQAIVPSGYEPIRDPSVLESLSKILIAKELTQVPVGQTMSVIDRHQERLIKTFNHALRVVGQEGNVKIPLKDNIDKTFHNVAEQYYSILPEGISTPTEIDQQVDSQTRQMIQRLENGRLDNDYDTTDDERRTATQIREKIGTVPPEELRRVFAESVYGRASDITRAQNGNRLAYHQQELSRAIQRLRHQVPNEWFSVDLLTNFLMLTPEERKAMQNIIWTVTPGNIHVRDISRIEEDFRQYRLSELSGNIFVYPATVNYVDKIRKIGGPFLQPRINKWATADIGGMIILRTLERDEPAAKFVVRDPVSTSVGLQGIGFLAREIEDLNNMMTDAVRNPEAALRLPIRPNKILELLPDPIVMQMPVISHPDGRIDYSPAVRGLEQRKNDLQTALRTLAIKTVPQVDAEGKPPTAAQRAITSLQRAIAEVDASQNRLATKNSQLKH